MNKVFEKLRNSKEKIIKFIIDAFFVITVLSFFVFSGNEKYAVTWIFFSVFSLLLFFHLFTKDGIKINKVVVLSFFFFLCMLVSYIVNGFKSIDITNILLVILFNVFFQYFIFVNNFDKVSRLIYYAILLFMIYFLGLYYKDILKGDIYRLGEEIANVNSVGFVFSVGVVFSIYNLVFKRKYYEIIFAIALLGLALLTGSKKVIFNVAIAIILSLIIFFGKKKWYYSLGITALFGVLFIVLLSIPQFNTIKIRFISFVNTILGDGTDSSTISRSYMIEEAIELFLKRPLFGWGFNGYQRMGATNGYSHNNFTELLTNFGIVSLLMFEYLQINPFLLSVKKLKEEKGNNVLVILLGAVLIFTQFGMVQIDYKDVYLYMALMNAYFYNSDKDKNIVISYKTFIKRKTVENEKQS